MSKIGVYLVQLRPVPEYRLQVEQEDVYSLLTKHYLAKASAIANGTPEPEPAPTLPMQLDDKAVHAHCTVHDDGDIIVCQLVEPVPEGDIIAVLKSAVFNASSEEVWSVVAIAAGKQMQPCNANVETLHHLVTNLRFAYHH